MHLYSVSTQVFNAQYLQNKNVFNIEHNSQNNGAYN